MRILQLIDSLEAGGAERMAVNYANALVNTDGISGLVATRGEGLLKETLQQNVTYLYLKKNNTIDFKALFKLRKFVVHHNFQWIHAHSSSYFLAVLLKVLLPSIKIIWHDHYGNSENLKSRPVFVLKFCSIFFSRIIAVNQLLAQWSQQNLLCEHVQVLSNFTSINSNNHQTQTTVLKGTNGKRIVCLANLRTQKNHDMLLNVAKSIREKYLDWTFHLIGKDFNDQYSSHIKHRIQHENLSDTVFIYGSCSDVSAILSKCNIGILTSSSEGLPVSLLEYGRAGLPVVTTNVGDVGKIINNDENGFLVQSENVQEFINKLVQCINDDEVRKTMANNLQSEVEKNYSEHGVIQLYKKYIS